MRGATRLHSGASTIRSISIHAPHAGCDRRTSSSSASRRSFQSTHPLRGATRMLSIRSSTLDISIHAPLAGCDSGRHGGDQAGRTFQSTHPLRGATARLCAKFPKYTDFNPRTPCGVRRMVSISSGSAPTFQSTHPLRGATRWRRGSGHGNVISIHAPLAGCDCKVANYDIRPADFNPRTPCGVRRQPGVRRFCRKIYFNPRTPCGVRRVQALWPCRRS